MATRVKKLFNKSEAMIPVMTENGQTLYLPPRGTMYNLMIENYEEILPFVNAEIDLGEVPPAEPKKGRRRING